MGIPMYVVLDPDYMKLPTGIQVFVRFDKRYRALPPSPDITWLRIPGQNEPLIGLRMEKDEEGVGRLHAWRPDGTELKPYVEAEQERIAYLEELEKKQAELKENREQAQRIQREQGARIAELEARVAALEGR